MNVDNLIGLFFATILSIPFYLVSYLVTGIVGRYFIRTVVKNAKKQPVNKSVKILIVTVLRTLFYSPCLFMGGHSMLLLTLIPALFLQATLPRNAGLHNWIYPPIFFVFALVYSIIKKEFDMPGESEEADGKK